MLYADVDEAGREMTGESNQCGKFVDPASLRRGQSYAAAYPDMYAAVGLLASAGYGNWSCFTSGEGIPVEESARAAFEEMRSGPGSYRCA